MVATYDAEICYGRLKELRAIDLILGKHGPVMLHIYGTRGIGKTVLLQKYCQEHCDSEIFRIRLSPNHPAEVQSFRMNQNETIFSPSATQSLPIDQLCEHINRIASRGSTVFIIDDFESWAPHHEWFISELLPNLVSKAWFLTASRYPLEQPWQPNGNAKQSIYHLELKPLDQTASFQYIRSFGIENFELLHNISKFCRGFPFALKYVSRDALNEGAELLRNKTYKRQFYQRAVNFLLEDMKLSHIQSKILDAASTLWGFDYDLITHLLQHEVTIQAFRKFCELPFVNLTSEGWQIHNSMRYWFRKEFSFRSPELHAAYQHKARSILLKRLHQRQPADRSELYLQLLHLIDQDILHIFCFLESFDEYDIRPLVKEELPTVRQMFVEFHNSVPAFFPDLTMQEDYLEAYWKLSPDTFYGFYKKNRLALFMSGLPLTPKIRKELSNNPTYSNYIKRSAYQENEVVIWIASFLPDFGASAVGLAFMYSYSRIAPNSLMTVITPFPEAHQLMDSVGFQRIPWGDYVSQDGVEYKAYQLDLREGLLSERFLVSRNQLIQPSMPSRLELTEYTKKVLMHFHDFEEHEDIVSAYPYLQTYVHTRAERLDAANQLRKVILSIIDEWNNGTGMNVMYGSILRMCYIQKSGNHEIIAQRLNMSLSTYYRNLKKATTKLSDLLCTIYCHEAE